MRTNTDAEQQYNILLTVGTTQFPYLTSLFLSPSLSLFLSLFLTLALLQEVVEKEVVETEVVETEAVVTEAVETEVEVI